MESIRETVGVAIVVARLDALWGLVKRLAGAPLRRLNGPEIHPNVSPGDRALIRALGVAAWVITGLLLAAVVVLVLAACGVIR